MSPRERLDAERARKKADRARRDRETERLVKAVSGWLMAIAVVGLSFGLPALAMLGILGR